jgi:hypothetical protein
MRAERGMTLPREPLTDSFRHAGNRLLHQVCESSQRFSAATWIVGSVGSGNWTGPSTRIPGPPGLSKQFLTNPFDSARILR